MAVIIPAFDVGELLDATLASIAGQSRPADIVVVANDCSSDDTVERARRWQGLLPIEVVSLERNEGPGPARDRAIRTTDTELIALLDADDLWLPDHLETIVAGYEAVPSLVSAAELSWMPGKGVDLAVRRRSKGVPTGHTAQLTTLLQRNYINFPLFDRATYDLAGGFRGMFRVGEDWDLWIRMVREGVTVTETTHPTALHRVRSHSLSADPRRTVELGIGVLSTAAEESRTPAERAVVEQGLRALRARKRYYDAYELAVNGHPWRARRAAIQGPRAGGWKVTAALMALSMGPRAWIRFEQTTRRYRVFRPM